MWIAAGPLKDGVREKKDCGCVIKKQAMSIQATVLEDDGQDISFHMPSLLLLPRSGYADDESYPTVTDVTEPSSSAIGYLQLGSTKEGTTYQENWPYWPETHEKCLPESST